MSYNIINVKEDIINNLEKDKRYTKLTDSQKRYVLYRLQLEGKALDKLSVKIGEVEKYEYQKFRRDLKQLLLDEERKTRAIRELVWGFAATLYNVELMELRVALYQLSHYGYIDMYRAYDYHSRDESAKRLRTRRKRAYARLDKHMTSKDRLLKEKLSNINTMVVGKDKLTWQQRIRKNKKWLHSKINREINKYYESEEKDINNTLNNIEKSVKKSLYQTGSLVVSEVNRAINYGGYIMLHNSIFNNKVVWSAVLDEKVCDDCASLDGSVFEVDNVPVVPPLHTWCRCMLIYV